VIAPDVQMVELDSEGVAFINAVLSARDRNSDRGVMVLHNGAEVIRVAGHVGEPAVLGMPVGEPSVTAERLRQLTGAATLTLVDSRLVDSLSDDLVELGRACATQGELLWRARDLWNRHAAVAQAPEPRASRWPDVEELLRRVGDGQWVVLRLRRSEETEWVFAARVEAGVISKITSVPPSAEDVSVTVELDVDQFRSMLEAPDPLAILYREASWRL
jgi:hypothetical protein